MLITNLTMLAVELRKLIGSDCEADMTTENTLTITECGNHAGEFRISATVADDICRVKISAGYNIRLENVVEAAAKLRADDVIHVYHDHAHVRKEYNIVIEQFTSFSAEQVEHAAKDIAGTLKSL